MKSSMARMMIQVAAAFGMMALSLTPLAANASNSNTQVILSATGVSTDHGPAGFWIWSEPCCTNTYGGSTGNGNGSIYFYTLLKGEHPVDVSNVSVSNSTVTETVTSKDGLVNCGTFTGTETSPGHGTVSFVCTVTTSSGPVTVKASGVPAQVNISSQASG